MKLRTIASAFCLLAGTLSANAAITIVANNDAQSLGNLLVGSGVTGSNFSISGNAAQFGTFSGGSSLGQGFFDQGLILSSGNVLDAAGPNQSTYTSTNFGGAGNSQLNDLGFSTLDAATLSFDFTTTGGSIYFNYFFASEEYNEYVGSQFNDVFGFFVNGENIAKLPNGDAVSINNVNNNSNSEFYNDNTRGDFATEYDGFTDVLTASVIELEAGTHNISISVADVSDRILDSAVFLQVGSFSDTITPPTANVGAVPEPATWIMMIIGFGVAGLTLKRRRRFEEE
ncbi:choice-of-anchor L family PEP-CTERM protein [Kordiimonas sp. SCSIO 12610]|uniref:choice-of-anchor L family PEP-CTERM protein n=1 Tax=Kordiimonas sp. SCSIO 12610 TaxID=2829597 RepID=UPI00210AEB4C|nr:choice-of-anchor L domain-containing protein [Kordiimonas sp. SCSIO 12610]UTW53908.1 PEP-CTERM sorting domain-containing protein [Kordiimonas sp. SCSIO 12610]